jgi:hypothetical protein
MTDQPQEGFFRDIRFLLQHLHRNGRCPQHQVFFQLFPIFRLSSARIPQFYADRSSLALSESVSSISFAELHEIGHPQVLPLWRFAEYEVEQNQRASCSGNGKMRFLGFPGHCRRI